CGTRASNDWRSCPQCGAPLAPASGTRPEPKMPFSPGVIDETAARRPSPWLYGIGAALIIVPLIVAAVLFFTDLFGSNPDTRFVVPGTEELDFDSTGEYTIFYEYRSSIDGKGYSTSESLKGVEVSLRSKDGIQSVPLFSSSWNTSYEIGSRAGKSLFEFEIEEPGTYILTTNYQDETPTPKVVFAIGPSFDIMGTILRSFGIGFGGFVLGVLLLLWVFLKRRQTEEQVTPPQIDP
ncbi:MAG: hypothetical protein GY845_22920, partial [Planctomycetes bacterium]|nr:hypothetical protein [Planctomycetota bacterium]